MRFRVVVADCCLLGLTLMAILPNRAPSEPAEPAPPATTRQSGSEPSGASIAFTTDDPVVLQARRLVADGHFADAEALLRQPGDAHAVQARAEMVDIIGRIRAAYGLDGPTLLAK